MKVNIKIMDILIILLAAAFTFYLVYSAYLKPHGAVRVLIKGQGRQWIFPLETEETVVVSGLLGDTIVKIDSGRAWVESSPCDNKTCIASGYVRRNGQWTACLPNNVLLIIQETGGEDADIFVW